MREKTQSVLLLAVGVFLGGAFLFGAYSLVSTVRSDHDNLQNVITFLNSQIKAAQSVSK